MERFGEMGCNEGPSEGGSAIGSFFLLVNPTTRPTTIPIISTTTQDSFKRLGFILVVAAVVVVNRLVSSTHQPDDETNHNCDNQQAAGQLP